VPSLRCNSLEVAGAAAEGAEAAEAADAGAEAAEGAEAAGAVPGGSAVAHSKLGLSSNRSNYIWFCTAANVDGRRPSHERGSKLSRNAGQWRSGLVAMRVETRRRPS
jgi:hypothetical protein